MSYDCILFIVSSLKTQKFIYYIIYGKLNGTNISDFD